MVSYTLSPTAMSPGQLTVRDILVPVSQPDTSLGPLKVCPVLVLCRADIIFGKLKWRTSGEELKECDT